MRFPSAPHHTELTAVHSSHTGLASHSPQHKSGTASVTHADVDLWVTEPTAPSPTVQHYNCWERS